MDGKMFDRPERMGSEAVVKESTFGRGVKVWSRAQVVGSHLGAYSSVGDDSSLIRSGVGERCELNRRNYIHDCALGDFTYTGQNAILHNVATGRFVSIASNVDVGVAGHDYHLGSMYPAEKLDRAVGGGLLKYSEPGTGCCRIGSDVWVGSGVIVFRDIEVGAGAVIGAGAVVNRSVPPYAIAAGVPAKVIGYRFEQDIIERLLKLAWWDFPLETILEHRALILSPVSDEWLRKMEIVKESLR